MFIYDVDEEIRLRMLNTGDAISLFTLTDQSRAYLRQWLPWLDDTVTVNDSQKFIENSFQLYAEQKGVTAGIFYYGQLVGMAGYNNIDWQNKIAYIGYWLGADFQGRGIMTRVVKALVDYAFEQLLLKRVDIRAASENNRSRAIPERLGFIEEGKIRQAEWLYDHFVDHIIYGMLESEWKNR